MAPHVRLGDPLTDESCAAAVPDIDPGTGPHTDDPGTPTPSPPGRPWDARRAARAGSLRSDDHLPDPEDLSDSGRRDGWTAQRQRAFLEALAEGHSVEDACRIVGMTHQSAYALRRRAAGAAFALG